MLHIQQPDAAGVAYMFNPSVAELNPLKFYGLIDLAQDSFDIAVLNLNIDVMNERCARLARKDPRPRHGAAT